MLKLGVCILMFLVSVADSSVRLDNCKPVYRGFKKGCKIMLHQECDCCQDNCAVTKRWKRSRCVELECNQVHYFCFISAEKYHLGHLVDESDLCPDNNTSTAPANSNTSGASANANTSANSQRHNKSKNAPTAIHHYFTLKINSRRQKRQHSGAQQELQEQQEQQEGRKHRQI